MIRTIIIADSIGPNGVRIITFQLEYPRFIHGEVMTHRVFSRNAMSSRAVPVRKMIEQVRNDPAMPVHWGANQPGMQAKAQVEDIEAAKELWLKAANRAADVAEEMTAMGLHKQVANRILEPFQWMHTIVTATEWDNFFELRVHEDAEPNFQVLARCMKSLYDDHLPEYNAYGEWHLPYIIHQRDHELTLEQQIKSSVARCARVSYLTHDGEHPSLDKDLMLYDLLVTSVPRHASPAEHQAVPSPQYKTNLTANFQGWLQNRKLIEAGIIHSSILL